MGGVYYGRLYCCFQIDTSLVVVYTPGYSRMTYSAPLQDLELDHMTCPSK